MRGMQGSSAHLDALPGSPAQPFSLRLLLACRWSAAALDFLAMATSAVLALLLGRMAEGAAGVPASQAALAAYACLAAASLASHCLAGPCASSAALRRQQALAVLLRVGWIVLRETAMGLVETSWHGSAAAAGGGAADDLQAARGWVVWLAALLRHALQLLVSSSALCMLLQSLRRIPLSLSIPTHLLTLVACSRRTTAACAAGPLAAPSAQQLTHQLYGWLRPLAFCAPLPLSLTSQQDAGGECRTLLRFLQAFVGTAVPLAQQAITEGRLFERHQAQRAAAGLPPERGVDASILTAVGGLLHEVLRPHLIIFAVFVTGSLWDWSCLISEPVAASPAP